MMDKLCASSSCIGCLLSPWHIEWSAGSHTNVDRNAVGRHLHSHGAWPFDRGTRPQIIPQSRGQVHLLARCTFIYCGRNQQVTPEEILIRIGVHLRVGGIRQRQRTHHWSPGSCCILGLSQNVRPQLAAYRRVETADRENVRVCCAFCDVPGRAIAAGLTASIVLAMILHNGAECCHHPGAPVQLAGGDLPAETGNIPAPKRNARGTGRESSHNGMAKCLPGRILIPRPVPWEALTPSIPPPT